MLLCDVYVDNNTCVDAAELLQLLKTVVNADNQGVVILQNVTSSQWVNDWDISHSVFFIATTLSTIGSFVHVDVSLHQSINMKFLYGMYQLLGPLVVEETFNKIFVCFGKW